MNQPVSLRQHIVFLGLRNAGKSSLVNAITGQKMSLVSEVKGTTTDPVLKSMEILPLGPVVIIDTPGIDDTGTLGQMRVARALEMLNRANCAVVVARAGRELEPAEQELCQALNKRKIPYLVVYNKADQTTASALAGQLWVSAKTGQGIQAFKEKLATLGEQTPMRPLVADLVLAGDHVILIVPIDEAAPKNRLILPQQMVLRELLDQHTRVLVMQPEELADLPAEWWARIKLVITDSQVFGQVEKSVPKEMALTSFSILMARFKGDLETLLAGYRQVAALKDGDKILVSEGCTHHRQCGDIGTVKIPAWVQGYTHRKLQFEFTAGNTFPLDLSGYALVIHCGGCMLTEREMQSRLALCRAAGVPVVNYGMLIAGIHGILPRALAPLAVADVR